ncbi:MAG TPA: 1-acyl-sn-glycerol-3-phosphate acyltransferase [Cyanobacteria bacterium UBA8803]|nr:1-acyl-sn-glycerol-3-phosphate acyltransferase [Cyanobacteria bacterium UBA9273]HBL60416.1 1-acyl-sn-glycerol-3-phosphate acyltransferase [Cyanobacteria bacterium UBA8803]
MQLQAREQIQTLTTVVETTSQTATSAKVVPVTSRVSRWLTPFLDSLGRYLLLPLYFRRLQVTGQENIPKTGSVILAPTHRSRWDGLVMVYAAGKPVTGRNLRFMISQDEMKGLQGWLLRRVGGFPVNTKQLGVSTIRHSVELLRDGEAMVMFPEGNIYRHGQINPLKPGMARIALQVESSQPGVELKIVPISIRYSHPIPHWGCDVKINIGTPLNVANYSTKSTKKSAQQLTSDLEIAMTKLDRD